MWGLSTSSQHIDLNPPFPSFPPTCPFPTASLHFYTRQINQSFHPGKKVINGLSSTTRHLRFVRLPNFPHPSNCSHIVSAGPSLTSFAHPLSLIVPLLIFRRIIKTRPLSGLWLIKSWRIWQQDCLVYWVYFDDVLTSINTF